MPTLDRLLLSHATMDPAATAIVTPRRRYTFGELAEASARYRAALQASGLRRGERLVAVLDPGFEAVALLCACAGAGVIYVPLSPENPIARIDTIVGTVRARAVICQAGRTDLRSELANRPIMLWGDAEGVELRVEGDPAPAPTPETTPSAAPEIAPATALEIDPAYIVFTSGSTGTPKGIVVSHRAACAFISAMVEYVALPEDAVVGSIAPIQFDFFLLDLGLALASGRPIAFIARHLFFQPRQLVEQMRTLGVTEMHGVPSLFTSLMRYAREHLRSLTALRAILFAGEPFPIPHLRELMSLVPGLRVINCFGQSESIACAFADVPNPIPPELERLSFGRGHRGVELLNIDDRGQRITSPGVVGELYLRAPNLFSGYWADPEATARALVSNPVLPETGEKVFKTGDLVYSDEAGNFYFVGRADDQVKVMGNRVELGEIGAVLCRMPAVANAVAVARYAGPETGASIVAYVVPRPDTQVTAESIRSFCLQTMPRHMLPADIQIRPALPLNENGKIDVRRIKAEWATT